MNTKKPDATQSEKNLSPIYVNIYTGYAWQKDVSAKDDVFWQLIRKCVQKETKIRIEGRPVKLCRNRMRATHAETIQNGLKRCFDNADILMFDLAKTPTKSGAVSSFNSNVLIEIGIALGRGVIPFLLCPSKLFKKIPSDLQGFFITLYDFGKDSGGNRTRKIKDSQGFSAKIREQIKQAARRKHSEQAGTPADAAQPQ